MNEPTTAAGHLGTYLNLRQRIIDGHHDQGTLKQFAQEAIQLAKLNPELVQSILEEYVKRNNNGTK